MFPCAVSAAAQNDSQQALDRKYQSAVSLYEAEHFREASAQLEELLPHAPNSFEIHELLGLAYASQSMDAKAIGHLEAAVRLTPDSPEARTNLAASISHAGYLLFAIAALGASSGSSVLVYATAYSIASIIAFGALIFVQQQSGSDNFESFNGLGKKNPFLALVLTIAMLSLAGIPLTAGFIGKF